MPSNHHYNKKLKHLARKLRNNPTRGEQRLWYELLAKRQFGGIQFLRQRIIANYIVDFFCKDLKLIIEVDGKTHEFEEVKINDIKREARLKELGYFVIRFTDYEVMHDLGRVSVMLTEYINELDPKLLVIKGDPDGLSLI